MKTLIASDLHIGPDGTMPIYAGDDALPAIIDEQAPDHVILNGDTFDLLLDDAPLHLDAQSAAMRIAECMTSAPGKKLVAALGAVLRADGEVLIRAGNHDLELAIPAVQDAARDVFEHAGFPAKRLAFSHEDRPLAFAAGAHNVLVTHGEHDDAFNRWRHDSVLAAVAGSATFEYPAGSILVKEILNPLKKQMRFVDLLKPDFHGAVMTALAVNPGATRQLITPATLEIIARATASWAEGAAFPAAPGGEVTPFERIVNQAGLDEDEATELVAFLDDAAAFGSSDSPAPGRFRRALDKIGRAALVAYAAAHRLIAGKAGERFFSEEPSDAEWDEAQNLAKEFNATIVVAGHTHARRFRHANGLVYANTGTWIRLLELPQHDSSVDAWSDLLTELRADPHLERSKRVKTLGTVCVIRSDASNLADKVELIRSDP